MTKSCCVKPIAKIIKVRDFEAGIVGLETVMEKVYRSGIKDQMQAEDELFRLVKECGNYISSGTENDYKKALLREYRTYALRIEREMATKRSTR